MADGTYTAHEVAVIIADLFGDDCAYNFNGNDEWLPYLCELQEACPHPRGVACRECKYHKDTSINEYEHCCLTGQTVQYDDFCSYGERKEGAD